MKKIFTLEVDSKAAEQSLKKLKAQMAETEKSLEQLNKDYKEGSVSQAKYEVETRKLTSSLKAQQKELAKVDKFSFGGIGKGITNLKDGFKGLTSTLPVLSKGLLGVGAAVAVTGIVPLAVAANALFQAFSKTKTGADLISKGLAAVEGVTNVLIRAFDGLVKNVVEFVSSADSFTDFGIKLKDKVLGVVEDVIASFGILGDVISNVVAGDFAKAQENAAKFGNALTEAITGSTAEELADEVGKLADEAEKAAASSIALDKALKALEVSSARISSTITKLSAQYDNLSAIADDDTLSFQKRLAAQKESINLLEQRAAEELKLAKANLAVAQAQFKKVQGTAEERAALVSLIQARGELEASELSYTNTVRDAGEQRRKIIRDEFEQRLDFAIDASNTQKSVLERQLADESVSVEQRALLLQQYTDLVRTNSEEQVRIIEEQTGKSINLNDLIATSDAAALNEKVKNLQLGEIEANRLLEVIRDTQTARQDVFETEQAIQEERNELDARNTQARIDLLQVELEAQSTVSARKLEILQEQYSLERELLNEQLEQNLISQEEYTARVAELDAKLANDVAETTGKTTSSMKERTLAQAEEITGAVGNFVGAAQGLLKEGSGIFKALGLIQATASYVSQLQNILATNSSPSQPGNAFTFGGAGIAASAIQIATATATYAGNIATLSGAAAGGGEFKTKGPTMLLVGDNPGGVERVTVEPISGKGQTKINPNGNLIAMAGGGTLTADSGSSRRNLVKEAMRNMDQTDILKDYMKNVPSPVVGVREYTKVQNQVNVKERTRSL